jgi:hypothetical protein
MDVMTPTRVTVRLGVLRLPRRSTLTRDDLIERIEAELTFLLTNDPRPLLPGAAHIRLRDTEVHVGSVTSAASVAQALARAIFLRMISGEGRA